MGERPAGDPSVFFAAYQAGVSEAAFGLRDRRYARFAHLAAWVAKVRRSWVVGWVSFRSGTGWNWGLGQSGLTSGRSPSDASLRLNTSILPAGHRRRCDLFIAPFDGLADDLMTVLMPKTVKRLPDKT